ncbi:MAG: molybdopterin-dependent oxidoreductase, partial [Alphaproteobacteria bacterium]|nr:molybdopterin-dependent oxidoreductase [Alphaproteobacteria bacterium]
NSTQMPHSSLRVLVDMLGRDENQVRVVTPDIGGGFGPKLVIYQEEPVLSVASIILGRPIKWIEDRREHFVASTQERDQYWEIEIAVDNDAHIRGIRGSIIHDHGAYTARGVNLAQNSGESLMGPYRLPAYQMNIRLALTNKVPVTPVRGAGHPQATFAMERMLDRVARELDIDRAEVRRRNLVPAEEMPYTRPLKTRGGQAVMLDSGDYPACQQRALDLASWSGFSARQQAALAEGRYIGIGMANFVKGTGRGPFEEVTVRVGTSGRIHVYTGAAAIGQGTRTMLAQIVAEELGHDIDNITVVTGDTAANSLGIGTSNSRVTVVAGTSAHVAARKVREKALKIAAHMLQTPVENLDFAGSEFHPKEPRDRVDNRWVTLAEIAHAVAGTPGYSLPGGMAPGLEATERVVLESKAFANGSAIAQVEVDPETGGVDILEFIIVHDCGRLVNPLIVDGQVFGGVAHGIGNALFEWMKHDDAGQPLTSNLGDYFLVTAPEMPRMEIAHMQSPSPLNPLGVKGVGECGVVPTPAAVISAIEDALSPFDVHIKRAPISPPELLALIDQARAATAG